MFRTQNDEPTLDDRLVRYPLVKRIGDAIARCEPPLVLGIHGDWGAGKTSFLHQLHWYLAGDCPQQSHGAVDQDRHPCLATEQKELADSLTVIWFEAWRYQYEKAPVVALLQEIRTQLPWYSKALNETKKLSTVAVRTALLSLDDLTKKIGVQAATVRTIQETGERWEQETLATALPAHVIRQHLDHALGQLLGRGAGKPKGKPGPPPPRPRLVVLVDDLDRCEPDAAYQLLEGIKIYLNLPSCVFVLGMNQGIIERAIAKHLRAEQSDEIRHLVAREYLEKLCQDIWHLPVLVDPAAFLEPSLPFNRTRDALCEVIRAFRCLPANPRKIKAFANVLGRLVAQLDYSAPLEGAPADDQRHARLIVMMACLYQFHPELYRLVEAYPRFYEQLRRWALGQPIEFDHPVLDPKHLQRSRIRPASAATADTAATAAETLIETFPDPVRGNVLRVQFLIESLGPVSEPELRRYLFQ